jgi:solute carrier family 30 (zinc transporter), member 9
MAAPASSVRAVLAALTANSFVTLLKFVAFALSGSGAMLSEAIHSAADTGNQLLLFLGLRQSSRQADEQFHYGYGGDRFVFGLLSASGIFFVGCGVTLYHGISGLLHPHMPELGWVTFAVLAASFVIEGSVLLYAVRILDRQRETTPFVRYVRESADPAAVAILLEDGAAVLGLALAAAGISAAYVTGNPMWDALGSIVVGLVLGGIAVHLVIENRTLLLGEAVPEGVEDRFVAILRGRPAVRDVRDVKTRQLTPEAYTLKAEVVLDDDFLADRIDAAVPARLAAIADSERTAVVRSIASRAIHEIAVEIAAMEAAIRADIPQARHIDLEVATEPENIEGCTRRIQ